jgi:glycosyltransferase involved in cell wall biosynthesis
MVGDAGIVVEPDDDAALVDAVATLLTDAPRARMLGADGRRRAFMSTTWTHAASRTMEAIGSLVTEGASR